MFFSYLGKSWFQESRSILREADLEPTKATFRRTSSVPEPDAAWRWEELRRRLENSPIFPRKSRPSWGGTVA